MNHWIVLFEDAPEMLAVREKFFADHVAYLTSQPDIFVDGTSLSPNEGDAPTGGMWIVKTRSKDEIVQLIDGDPMFQSGHRTYESLLLEKCCRLIDNTFFSLLRRMAAMRTATAAFQTLIEWPLWAVLIATRTLRE